ncbi:MAG: thioredoxin [Myxococcota bacterium]
MATVELTKENFDETIRDNSVVVLDFWAEWCGPCKAFAPVFEKASDENDDIVFAKINTEDQPELAQQFGVSAIPTLVVFKEQIGIFQQPGAMPPAAFGELIEKVRDVDMDDVRAKIAEHEASGG